MAAAMHGSDKRCSFACELPLQLSQSALTRYPLLPVRSTLSPSLCLSVFLARTLCCRTAVNAASGARTPLSSALTALVLIILLCAAAPQLSNLPKVAAASVVLLAVRRLLEVREVIRLWRSDKRDWLVAVAVIVTIITADVGPGLAVGVALQWLVGLSRGFSLRSEVVLWQLLPTASASTGAVASDAPPHLVADAIGKPRSASKGAISAWSVVTSAIADASSAAPAAGQGSSTPEAAALAALASAVDTTLGGADPASATSSGAVTLQWQRTSESDSASAAAIASAGALGAMPAVALLRFEPGLQFAEAERLSSHMEEAAACYKPLATVLDGPRIGVMDSTGAVQLLLEGDDAVSRRVALSVPANVANMLISGLCISENARFQQQRAAAPAARSTPQGDAPDDDGLPVKFNLEATAAAAALSTDTAASADPSVTTALKIKLRSCLVVGGLNRHVLTRLLRTAAANGNRIRAVFPSEAAAPAPAGQAQAACGAASSPAGSTSASAAASASAARDVAPAPAASTPEQQEDERIAAAARAAGGNGVLRVGQLFVTETSDGAVAFACELIRLRVAAATLAEAHAASARAATALAVALAAGATLSSPTSSAAAAAGSAADASADSDVFSPSGIAATVRPLAPSDASAASVIAVAGAGGGSTSFAQLTGTSAHALELQDDADDAEEDKVRARAGLRRRVRGIPLSSWSKAAQRNRRLREPLVQALLTPQLSQAPRTLVVARHPLPSARGTAAASMQQSNDAAPLPSVRLFRKLHGAAAQIATRSSQPAPAITTTAVAVASASVRVEIVAEAASGSAGPDPAGTGIELAPHLRLRSGAAAASGDRETADDEAATASTRDARPSTSGRAAAANDCAAACSRLRPPPLSWLEPAVAAEYPAAAPAGAAPAGAAAVPRATRWREALQRRTMALLRAPVHAAVGAVLGLTRVAAVFGETRPFLQPG